MKQKYTLFFLFLYFFSFAQTEIAIADCGSDHLIENKNNFSQDFEYFNEKQNSLKQKNPVTYYIPVVFHVIHAGEAIGTDSNVSDYTIYKALETLNNNYLNHHNNVKSSNTNIQFVLASKDPKGNCSSGINRINYGYNQTYVQHGNQYSTSDNGVSATTIRTLSNWDPTKYYNIWVVNKITSSSNVSGYAYLAASHGQPYDGTFIAYPYLNTKETTLTHELGHALNLSHTFQGSTGTNCPAQINGCGNDGDCVSDTPPHTKTHTIDLNLTAFNSCTNNNDSSFKNNYMSYNYSEYQTVFTPLQVARMQNAVTYYRSSYLPTNNSVFTMTKAPNVDFYINESRGSYKRFFCPGAPIQLLNSSTCFLNTFNKTSLSKFSVLWEIKRNNQTVLTSTEPNPTITITQPGTYSIVLTATNNVGKNSLTKSNVIEIVQPKTTVTYCAPKSSNTGKYYTSINQVNINRINNITPLNFNESYKDFSCTYITQVSSTAQNKIDVWISNNLNNNTGNLNFHGYIDYNQNGSFETNELIFSQIVPPNTINKKYTFNFSAPTNVKTDEILRMRLVSELNQLPIQKVNCTSALYIGDVEDYGLIFVKNLSNNTFELNDFSLYPNPVKDILTIKTANDNMKTVEIYTLSGQIVESLKTNEENIVINVSKLASGTYLLKINDHTEKFIKH